MFRLAAPPTMEKFAQSLGELGFQLTDSGQIRNIATGNFFDYFYSDDEDLNDRRKEAVHDAAREVVIDVLKRYNIVPVHVKGTDTYMDKPKGAHVTITATELGKLRAKKDVVVVIGETGGGSSGQDAAIWGYRTLMREGGLKKGSAVGMARMLRRLGKAIKLPGDEDGSRAEAGVVILNPGQLFYSHEHEKPMSQTTWQAREKKTSLSSVWEVEDDWNTVPMHATANRHIHNVLAHILPELLNKHARVHMLCIGDSVKDTVDYLDWLFYQNSDDTCLVAKLASMVFLEPNHQPEVIQSPKFRDFLLNNGIAYVNSETAPVGRLVASPGDVEELKKHADTSSDKGWIKISYADPDDSDPDDPDPDFSSDEEDGADDDRRDSKLEPDDDNIETTEVEPDDNTQSEIQQVSMRTYSAGNLNNKTELMMPNIMNRVLGFFWKHMTTREDFEKQEDEEKEVAQKQEPSPEAFAPYDTVDREEDDGVGDIEWARQLMLALAGLKAGEHL